MADFNENDFNNEGKKEKKEKFNMANMSWGSLTGILVVLLALIISPIDICSGDLATAGIGGLTDDIVYLVGVAKVIWEMVEKQQMAKEKRDAKKQAKQEAEEAKYRDVDSN